MNPRRVNEEDERLRRRHGPLLSVDALGRWRTGWRSWRHAMPLTSQRINVHMLSFIESRMLTLEFANGLGCRKCPVAETANYSMEVADLKINARDTR